MKILLLLFLFLPTLSFATTTKDNAKAASTDAKTNAKDSSKSADITDDDFWTKLPKSTSISACHDNVLKLANTLPEEERDSTMGQSATIFAETNCVKKIVTAELDKRLLPLKKSNPAQFKIEMKMQKDFNVGSEKACNFFNDCVNDGTLVKLERANCFLAMQKMRADQAIQLSKKKLSFASKKANTAILPDMAKISELSDFATSLCAIPDITYAEKRTKDECKALVIQNLASAENDEDPENATDPFHCDKTPLGE